MKKLLGIIVLINSQLLGGPSIITYLQNPPLQAKRSIQGKLHEISTKINKFANATPAKASRKLLKGSLLDNFPRIDGFLALYKGYSTHSDPDGQIAFPLRHSPATKVTLVITSEIELLNIDSYTFAHLQIPQNSLGNSVSYVYEKKEVEDREKKEKKHHWTVTQIPPSMDGKITPDSVILLTKPKNIYVQEGDFISSEDANLVMPNNIYVVGNKNNVKTLLSFLDLAEHFEPIKFKVEKPKETLQQKAMENN